MSDIVLNTGLFLGQFLEKVGVLYGTTYTQD